MGVTTIFSRLSEINSMCGKSKRTRVNLKSTWETYYYSCNKGQTTLLICSLCFGGPRRRNPDKVLQFIRVKANRLAKKELSANYILIGRKIAKW